MLDRNPLFLRHDDGVNQTHLSNAVFTKFPALLPPLTEQAVIVEYLDKATADIDAATGRANREVGLLNEYRTRLVADVVTGKVDVRGAAAALPGEDPLDDEDDLDDAVDPGGEANVEGLDAMLEGAEA